MTDRQIEANRNKFAEMRGVFEAVLEKIDTALKNRLNEKYHGWISSVEEGIGTRKDFLLEVESEAIAQVAKDLGKSQGYVRDRWKSLSLPMPIYSCLENGTVSLGRSKMLAGLHLCPEDEDSIRVADELVCIIKDLQSNDKVEKEINTFATTIWNLSTSVMEMLIGQHERGEM